MPMVRAVSKNEDPEGTEPELVETTAGSPPSTQGMSLNPGEFKYYTWLVPLRKDAESLRSRLSSIPGLAVQVMG